MGDWALLFVKFNRFLVRSNATKNVVQIKGAGVFKKSKFKGLNRAVRRLNQMRAPDYLRLI